MLLTDLISKDISMNSDSHYAFSENKILLTLTN